MRSRLPWIVLGIGAHRGAVEQGDVIGTAIVCSTELLQCARNDLDCHLVPIINFLALETWKK